jgi:hypothetical protein
VTADASNSCVTVSSLPSRSTAFGMTGVFELGELGVRPAILADGELGDEQMR